MRVGGLVAVALGVGCRGPVELPTTEATGDTAPPGPAGVTVHDVAAESGFQDFVLGNHFKRGRGCAVADLDRDGRPDLVLANPSDETYVLLNRSTPGELHFEPGPVLSQDGVIWTISAADIDGDRDLDLFLAVGGIEDRGLDRLLRNEWAETGELTFTDIGESAGVTGPPSIPDPANPADLSSLAGSWVDFDGDADLDLHVDTSPWPKFWLPPKADTRDGAVLLYRNDGSGGFTEVAAQVGLTRQISSRFSSWLDFDGDGDLDLYENAMGPWKSALFRNDAGQFTDVTSGAALDGGDLSMPPETFVSTAADFNNDGWEDLLLFVRGFPTGGPYRLGHTLLLNAGGAGFVDATEVSDLNNPFLAGLRDHGALGVMGASARDINGDGLPDVFAGNGGPDGGYINGLYVTTGLVSHDFDGIATLDVPTFENWNALIDSPAPEDPGTEGPYPPYPYRSHAACIADLDGDGGVELAVMNGGMKWVGGEIVREPNRLFRFDIDPAPRWLKVELLGDGVQVPWTPVGSRIAVTAARGTDTWVVRDTLRTTEGFAAQHGTVRWLGLANAERIESLEVTWPDGTVTTRTDVDLDSLVVLER